MRKILKTLAILTGLLLLFGVTAVIVLPMLVDPNVFKELIVSKVGEKTGRSLKIDGDLKLTVFPWVGIEVGAAELSDRPGSEGAPFARIQRAAIHVRLLPLLKEQLEVDTVALDSLELNLVRDADGRGNWEDLAKAGPAKAEGGEQPPATTAQAGIAALTIGGVQIRDGSVRYDDRATGQRLSLSGINLESGAVRAGKPIPLQIDFAVASTAPAMDAHLKLDGEVTLDQPGKRVAIAGLIVTLDAEGEALAGARIETRIETELELKALPGREGFGALQGMLTGLQIQSVFRQGEISGETHLSGDLRLDGPTDLLAVDRLRITGELQGIGAATEPLKLELATALRLAPEAGTLELAGIELSSLPLRLTGELGGKGLNGSPELSGRLAVAEFSPRELLGRLGIEPPATGDPNALTRISADLSLSGRQAPGQPFTVALEPLRLELDDSRIEGKLSAIGEAIRFQLALDTIDLNRYLPPQAPDSATADAPPIAIETGPAGAPKPPGQSPGTQDVPIALPVELLRGLDLDGTLTIGELKVQQMKLGGIRLKVGAAGGRLQLDNQIGRFYEGTLGGNIGLDLSTDLPAVRLKQSLQGAQIGPLLQDLSGQDRITGKGSCDVDLNGRGATTTALKRDLGGNLALRFENGAIKGINLAQTLREAKARFSGEALAATGQPQQTDFSELSATAVITRGVLRNEDLLVKSPFIRVTGAGSAELVEERIDYTLTTVLVASAEGQGGAGLGELEGVPIPVQITGAFAAPRYSVDWARLITETQKERLKEKAEEKIQEKLGDKLEKNPALKDALKGLFGR